MQQTPNDSDRNYIRIDQNFLGPEFSCDDLISVVEMYEIGERKAAFFGENYNERA
jgi:hypothetical protein